MPESLKKYLIRKWGTRFKILSHDRNGKDWTIILDFGDGEKMGVSVRERNGGNGNYRVTAQWDESEDN